MQETRETRVQSLGQEDSRGAGQGTPLQYSCLGNPRTEEPGGRQSWATVSQTVKLYWVTERAQTHTASPHTDE